MPNITTNHAITYTKLLNVSGNGVIDKCLSELGKNVCKDCGHETQRIKMLNYYFISSKLCKNLKKPVRLEPFAGFLEHSVKSSQ